MSDQSAWPTGASPVASSSVDFSVDFRLVSISESLCRRESIRKWFAVPRIVAILYSSLFSSSLVDAGDSGDDSGGTKTCLYTCAPSRRSVNWIFVTISWGHVIMWGGTTRRDRLVARAALNSGELCSCFELGSILLILIDNTHVYRFISLTYYQYRMVTTSSITTRWREKCDMRNVNVTAPLIFLLPPYLIFLLYYFIFIQMSFCLYLLQFRAEI